jgi:pimeloyl-ACP methyl ester carboxylesterase
MEVSQGKSPNGKDKEEVSELPTLVLIHGLGVDHRMWNPVLEELSKSYHVFNIDLPGFGAEPPENGGQNASLINMADWLAKEISANLKGKTYLVGYSMGTTIAQLIALRHPHLVDRVALICGTARWGGSYSGRLSFLSPLLGRALQWWAWHEIRGATKDPELLETAKDMLDRAHRPTMGRLMSGLLNIDLRPKLGDIECPVLIIVGGKDWMTPPNNVREIVTGIKDASAITIPEAKHFLSLTHSKRMAKLIVDFGPKGSE